jgi:predicted RNA-binding Zn-ribbon protein involved in translation (DUF1610 family)
MSSELQALGEVSILANDPNLDVDFCATDNKTEAGEVMAKTATCPKCGTGTAFTKTELNAVFSGSMYARCSSCHYAFRKDELPGGGDFGDAIMMFFGPAEATLIPCPDCGTEISRRARQCPDCGAPMD